MLLDVYSPSGVYDNIFLANYATINLQYALTRISGVSQVQIFGAGQYAMRCWVNPDRLASLGVTVPEVTNAIRACRTKCQSGRPGRRRAEFLPASSLPATTFDLLDGLPRPQISSRSSFGPNPTAPSCA